MIDDSMEASSEMTGAVVDRRVLRGHRGSVLTLFGLDNLLLSGGRDNVVRYLAELYHLIIHNHMYQS